MAEDTIRIPIQSSINPRSASSQKDSTLVNGFLEESALGTGYTKKRPGIAAEIFGLGLAEGTYYYNGQLFIWSNGILRIVTLGNFPDGIIGQSEIEVLMRQDMGIRYVGNTGDPFGVACWWNEDGDRTILDDALSTAKDSDREIIVGWYNGTIPCYWTSTGTRTTLGIPSGATSARAIRISGSLILGYCWGGSFRKPCSWNLLTGEIVIYDEGTTTSWTAVTGYSNRYLVGFGNVSGWIPTVPLLYNIDTNVMSSIILNSMVTGFDIYEDVIVGYSDDSGTRAAIYGLGDASVTVLDDAISTVNAIKDGIYAGYKNDLPCFWNGGGRTDLSILGYDFGLGLSTDGVEVAGVVRNSAGGSPLIPRVWTIANGLYRDLSGNGQILRIIK